MSDYKSWLTGISINCTTYTHNDFERFKKAGVDAVEISPRFGNEEKLDWDAIGAEAQRTGMMLNSYHLPFSRAYTVSDPDEEKRRAVVANNIRLMRLAAAAGVKIMVVHPSTEPISDEERPLQMEQSKKSLRELAEEAEKLGVTVAVEDLPRSCLGHDATEMKELLSADGRLRMCFDVNHLLRDSHQNVMEAVGDQIITLHISDYNFEDECHFVPGVGHIDWKALVELLEEADYNGVFMYEVSFDAYEKMSIATRAHSYDEIHDNHMNIKTFTGEGKRI